jgi:hypothetical protein
MTHLPGSPPAARRQVYQRHWTWWLMVVVLVIVASARLRLLNFPLERDEGEYAYAGQLILQGIPPYELAYNMKFPGTYLAYAGIMSVFGQTTAGIHLGLLLMTTATALMLFWLGGKILDELAGVVAATSYVLLAAGPSMFGLAGHATHFCAFFVTAGLCLMWCWRQNGNPVAAFASGVLFGTAVLMKQHATLIGAWAGIAFAMTCFHKTEMPIRKRFLSTIACACGMILPLVLCCLILWHVGVLEKFWFWTVIYARQYASLVPLSYALGVFRRSFYHVITSGFLLWLIAFAGMVIIWFDARWKNLRGWFFGFCVASALAVCPDFYFRKHYFLIALPAVALLVGAAISGLRKIWGEKNKISRRGDWPLWIYALAVALTIFTCAWVWFESPLPLLARHLYGADPLPESEIVAKFINENSAPIARIAILGSEPEIYFLAHRHSATGYIYTYPLMEPQPFALKMQHEMIGDIETNQPEFIVFAENIISWNRRPESDATIFKWWDDYKTNYTLVGLTDIISPTNTIIVLGTNYNIARYPKVRGSALEIYQCK